MNSRKTKNEKPLSFYLNRHYPTTFYPDDDGGFTVMIKDLPGCTTQGDTAEEAFEMIAEAKELWIESCYEDDVPIPPPSTEVEYSGKTMLRMPQYLHQRLAESAKREGVSLNQYLVSLLSERDALKVVSAELTDIREQLKQQEPVLKKERLPYLVSDEKASYTETEKNSTQKVSEHLKT